MGLIETHRQRVSIWFAQRRVFHGAWNGRAEFRWTSRHGVRKRAEVSPEAGVPLIRRLEAIGATDIEFRLHWKLP